jgi:hypothetical protein
VSASVIRLACLLTRKDGNAWSVVTCTFVLIPARTNSARAWFKDIRFRLANERTTRKTSSGRFTVVRMITTVAFELLKAETQNKP